jgi:hypothetical protein
MQTKLDHYLKIERDAITAYVLKYGNSTGPIELSDIEDDPDPESRRARKNARRHARIQTQINLCLDASPSPPPPQPVIVDLALKRPASRGATGSDGRISREKGRQAPGLAKKRRIVIDDATPTPSPCRAAAAAAEISTVDASAAVEKPHTTVDAAAAAGQSLPAVVAAVAAEQPLPTVVVAAAAVESQLSVGNIPVQVRTINITIWRVVIKQHINGLHRLRSITSMANPITSRICGWMSRDTIIHSWIYTPLTFRNQRAHQATTVLI